MGKHVNLVIMGYSVPTFTFRKLWIKPSTFNSSYIRPGFQNSVISYDNNAAIDPHLSWWRYQMETFSAYWPFVQEIHRPSVNSLYKGQWRGALMFYFICAGKIRWVSNRNAGDWRRYRAHYDVIVMCRVTDSTHTILHLVPLPTTYNMCEDIWMNYDTYVV